MPINIRQAFLYNAENHYLYGFWEASEIFWGRKGDLKLAPRLQTVDVATKRRDEACLIQQRRMKQVRGGPNFLD